MAKNIGIVDKNNNLVDQAGLGVATPVVDNLTSDSTTSALSAKQGKLLNSNKSNIIKTATKTITTDGQGLYAWVTGANVVILSAMTTDNQDVAIYVLRSGPLGATYTLFRFANFTTGANVNGTFKVKYWYIDNAET